MLQIKYHSGPLPRPKLRATEQCAGRDPRGASGAEILVRARTQNKTDIEGQGAACWWRTPRLPEKGPWTAIRGAKIPARARACCQTEIEGHGAAPGWGPPRRHEKGPWTAIQGSENTGLPRYIGER